MPARKLFEILMGLLAYLLVTLLWFAYTVPEMLGLGTDAALITAGFGSMVWLAASGCIVIYFIQKARP
ncbi:hypothetical protein BK652_09575 [Pseudomonas brassicacearum]|uniref:Uncharacterized protein n=1 Tax=Pseudomonas brassicacearum TaxID=930166 RepID=A0A423GDA0_9PSED|nr:hypothetical protein [Pseudomonas brassicacearum]ROM84822.1 hypothetical protein BK652_09575 [Pseudomonas brassicacearum]